MRYHVLACDYDGTLALHGKVDEPTVAALHRLRATGRRLVLVTGRVLPELHEVFPELALFDRVVAENGALLYRPDTHEEVALEEAPPAAFLERLGQRGVAPAVGRVIVATWEPHDQAVFETIHELGLELQVIFNKGAVMVLPSGVNKASGLRVALDELGLSPHNVVSVGDAENDHALLHACECGVAVANALPVLKDRADLVTQADHGGGVTELIDRMITTDLAELEPRLQRHEILLGTRSDDSEVRLKPYGVSLLLSGTSGSGKSTFALGVIERLGEKGYQYCVIDPEGDYPHVEGAIVLGSSRQAPLLEEVAEIMEQPGENVVVNLIAVALDHRPAFFERLFALLMELRARTGRPHWIVMDETHHLFPPTWTPATTTLPRELHGLMLITVHPNHVAPALLRLVDSIVAIGENPGQTIGLFAQALDEDPPAQAEAQLAQGEAVGWWRHPRGAAFRFRTVPPKAERRRHIRKYAEGELAPEYSFYFRGPRHRLNLRAQNLKLFLQIADGVDDDTWLYHLRRGDYSQWFRRHIKDPALAAEAEEIEQRRGLNPRESRRLIREHVEQRYTAPP